MTTRPKRDLPGTFGRWLYRNGRPSALASAINRIMTMMARKGVGPPSLATLEITGRRSGRPIAFPIVVADHDGERYAVAMLGEGTSWVANVRAAQGKAFLQRGPEKAAVHLAELPVEQRPPVLKRYLEVAPGARPHIPVDYRAPVQQFGAIAAQYPVFRITSVRP
jgi:deazaflavin-dependent oxidoreductase (nitroreductase family)